MRKVNGSPNTDSSRLPDAKKMATLSPAGIGTPAISLSTVVYRMKWMIGLRGEAVFHRGDGHRYLAGVIQRILDQDGMA